VARLYLDHIDNLFLILRILNNRKMLVLFNASENIEIVLFTVSFQLRSWLSRQCQEHELFLTVFSGPSMVLYYK
jgi:hypothetical protein